jgi:hypothetical protein
MNRTVSALYDTQIEAERARDALQAHGLAGHVEIHDQESSESKDAHGKPRAPGWLHGLFGGHKDAHVYGEGLRRGHVLLTARVEDSKEALAAELMSGAQPLNLAERQEAWRRDGWSPAVADQGAYAQSADVGQFYDSPTAFGPGINVRSYVTSNAIDYSTVPG